MICLYPVMVWAQQSSPYERYFTWNPDSTIVYTQPDRSSTKLATLAYGTEVKILEALKNKKSSILIGNANTEKGDLSDKGDFYLPGSWIKITSGKYEGYVFDGEIINFPPMTVNHGSYTMDIEDYSYFFGTEIKEEESKRPVVLDGNTYYVYETLIRFPDGSYEKTDLFDGCFDHEYHFKGKSAAQVYFIFITQYYELTKSPHWEYGRPKLDAFEGSKLLFTPAGIGASDGLFIDLDSEGKITFGSYDCT